MDRVHMHMRMSVRWVDMGLLIPVCIPIVYVHREFRLSDSSRSSDDVHLAIPILIIILLILIARIEIILQVLYIININTTQPALFVIFQILFTNHPYQSPEPRYRDLAHSSSAEFPPAHAAAAARGEKHVLRVVRALQAMQKRKEDVIGSVGEQRPVVDIGESGEWEKTDWLVGAWTGS